MKNAMIQESAGGARGLGDKPSRTGCKKACRTHAGEKARQESHYGYKKPRKRGRTHKLCGQLLRKPMLLCMTARQWING